MTLSVSDSKKGAVIRGEVQLGQVLLVNYEEAYNIIHRDINGIQQWAPLLASCSILDNRFESWEVGARRRVVIAKAPYKDVVVREILTEKAKSESRAHVTFTYSPLESEETSFSSLRLDSCQKIAKCMSQKGPLAEPEAPNVSEAMHSTKRGSSALVGISSPTAANALTSTASTAGSSVLPATRNKYASDDVTYEPIALKSPNGATAGFAPPRTPTRSSVAGDSDVGSGDVDGLYQNEAPTILTMKTTYSFNALSGGIATTGRAPQLGATAGELRCFMEVLVEYSLSCETPGAHDERLIYDHGVLRTFLQQFWVREISEAFANYAHAQAYHLTDGGSPLKGVAIGYGSIKTGGPNVTGVPQPPVLGGPSDARLNAVADKIGLRFAEEQSQYDAAVTELAAKAKTAADDQLADTMMKMLGSWEKVTNELKRSQEMVERLSHELDAAKLITNAATGFNSAAERGRVVYDFEENKRL